VAGNPGQARFDHNRPAAFGVIKSGSGAVVTVTAVRTSAVTGVAVLTALLVACGGPAAAPTATVQPTTVPGPDPVQVRVTQVVTGKKGPIEGAVAYLRIDRTGGGTVINGRLPGRGQVTLGLPAGRYRLQSWQRVCDGNCSQLEPPSVRCARIFALRSGQPRVVTIRVQFPSTCTVWEAGPG
jgi:hypothetical protein